MSIKLAPIALLTRVLHVSKLFVSLVSIQRISKSEEHKIRMALDGFWCVMMIAAGLGGCIFLNKNQK